MASKDGDSLNVLRAELTALRERVDYMDKANTAAFTAFAIANEKAVTAAFSAAERAVQAAFASQEKAAEKFVETLDEYKRGANEWRDTVKDLIGNLRESRSSGEGKDLQTKWIIGLAATAVGYLLHWFAK